MESPEFNYASPRAVKARFGYRITRIWRQILTTASILLPALGVTLVVLDMPVGWLLVGLAAIPIMIYEWWKGELHHLSTGKNAPAIDALLSGDVLGQLSAKPTPREIALAAGSVPGGQFLGARLGITANTLLNVASDDPKMTARVWQEALAVREQSGSEHINGAVLAIAVLRSFDEHEGLLAHMHLDMNDLMKGIGWFNHLHDLVEKTKTPLRTGGIARDFSFGYIPLLRQFGQNLSQLGGSNISLESHQDILNQLTELFGNGGGQNAVLVGPAGVGKAAVVQAFADRIIDGNAKIPANLKYRQIFLLDSSALLAAAPGRGEAEGLVMRVLGEAYAAKNIIICLDNAQLFFEEGVGSIDLSNVLLPILEAGNLRIILTMDEQRFLQIGQRNPGLVNAMNRISVAPASHDETIMIMQDELIRTEFKQHVTYMYQALGEAYRLSERYVHDLAMPGRALKLLESAANYPEDHLVTGNSVQQAIEQTLNIKVGVANDDTEREKLLHLEDLIHERMINQTRAVSVVSDALRRARSGVRNENRPIGTFLFLGPTGVGKTELSKALSDVYFGGEGNMIRLDLNEFVRPDDVARLIADGADDPQSLTAQAMKQPFSVVLLDEIEKAHPQVLTTLLQLLDEGILRDIKNREVSFRDAIVIATSNAGADRIREYIERGYKLDDFEDKFVDELINTNQFRPEFLNRFDEIVIFRPLEKPELLQVIDLILNGINKQLAPQKITISVADDAKLFLVDRGYDPRLGARPMRRVVQRAVENLVAKQMLSGEVSAGSVIEISLDQVTEILGSEKRANEIVAETSANPVKQDSSPYSPHPLQ